VLSSATSASHPSNKSSIASWPPWSFSTATRRLHSHKLEKAAGYDSNFKIAGLESAKNVALHFRESAPSYNENQRLIPSYPARTVEGELEDEVRSTLELAQKKVHFPLSPGDLVKSSIELSRTRAQRPTSDAELGNSLDDAGHIRWMFRMVTPMRRRKSGRGIVRRMGLR